MVAAMRGKGLPVAYIAFPGEGHGFRQGPNIRMALDGELAFYAAIFGFQPAGTLPHIQIENLGRP
jgi:dipeptidyl aminopeptidase/acylaminoacyl peptidase